jgi:hypothetical protein
MLSCCCQVEEEGHSHLFKEQQVGMAESCRITTGKLAKAPILIKIDPSTRYAHRAARKVRSETSRLNQTEWWTIYCYPLYIAYSRCCSWNATENKCHQLAAAQNVQKTCFISWLHLDYSNSWSTCIDCAIYLMLKVAADVWGRQQATSPAAGVLTLSGAAFEWALTTSAESMKPMASKCHLIYARGDSLDTFGDK